MFIDTNICIPTYISCNPTLKFLLVVNDVYDRLLIQSLTRAINGRTIEFLAIRDVKINSPFQRQQRFTSIISALKSTNRPLIIDNIINPELYNSLLNKGWLPHTYSKDNKEPITSVFWAPNLA